MAKLTFKYVPPDGLPGSAPTAPADPLTVPRATDGAARSFHESSWDLRHGLQVSEDAHDDIPGELFDELFRS